MFKLLIYNEDQLYLKPLKSSISEVFKEAEVQTVNTTKVIARKFMDFTPDVLVYFCKHPVKGTIKIIEDLKQRFSNLKVVFISNNANKRIIKEMCSNLVDAYLVGKASCDDLMDAIKAVKEKKSYVCTEVLKTILLEMRNPFVAKYNLNQRELEVLTLLAEELPSKQIADKLHVSPHTIETNKRQLMKKFNVRSSIGLAKIALREGLVF